MLIMHLDSALLHIDTEKELSIALIVPAHPIIVPPFLDGFPRLDGLAIVLLRLHKDKLV